MYPTVACLVSVVFLSACVEPSGDGGGQDQGDDGLWMGDTGQGTADGGAGDGGSGGSGGVDTGGDGGGVDLSEACHPDVADWPAAWSSYEEQVVELTNQARAEGQDCGAYGVQPPAGPVEMDPAIRCAARYHSLWMADNDVFDHDSPGGALGDDPWTRMANAGFTGSPTGENIAAGYRTPAEIVQGWIDSDGHCANLMNPDATLIGVGYAEGGSYGTYWTQDYGR